MEGGRVVVMERDGSRKEVMYGRREVVMEKGRMEVVMTGKREGVVIILMERRRQVGSNVWR